jgi:hypothetical protein
MQPRASGLALALVPVCRMLEMSRVERISMLLVVDFAALSDSDVNRMFFILGVVSQVPHAVSMS